MSTQWIVSNMPGKCFPNMDSPFAPLPSQMSTSQWSYAVLFGTCTHIHLTSSLNPAIGDDPMEYWIDIGESCVCGGGMALLASAKGNKVSTCLRTEILVEFKSQPANQFSLYTHVHEHISPLHSYSYNSPLSPASLRVHVPLDWRDTVSMLISLHSRMCP